MQIQKGAMIFGHMDNKHVEGHEITLPQHTEVIILLETTG